MKAFSALIFALDEMTGAEERVAALTRYFEGVAPASGAWALELLLAKRRKKSVPATVLASAALEASGLPEWLFTKCLETSGDLSEAAALMIPESTAHENQQELSWWMGQRVLPLSALPDSAQADSLRESWSMLSSTEKIVFNRIVGGSLGIRVPQELIVAALSRAFHVPRSVITHRLAQRWVPTFEAFIGLVTDEVDDAACSRPYPLGTYRSLACGLEELGDPSQWLIEHRPGGLRAQIVRRSGQVFVWSEGEGLLSSDYPNVCFECGCLEEGTVLDGILVDADTFVAFDILESEGVDVRSEPLASRRAMMGQAFGASTVSVTSWSDLSGVHTGLRDAGYSGLLLRRLDAPYPTGGLNDGWAWNASPLSVKAVLIYAQPVLGKQLRWEVTLGVWNGDILVPIAKTAEGLTDEEWAPVDEYIRNNTLERFGTVRNVRPELVFELSFDSIQPSKRRKSGVIVNNPRITKWDVGASAETADELEGVRKLL